MDSHLHQILPDSASVGLVFALTEENNLWPNYFHREPLEAIVGAHEQDAAPMLETLLRVASQVKCALDLQLIIEWRADDLLGRILVGLKL